MKVLGIDPGFGRMGWAVVSGTRARQELVACGCVETDARAKFSDRLMELYRELNLILTSHNPDEAAVEELFYFKNQKTVIGVGQARGVVVLALAQEKVAMFDYTPLQIKRAITGYGQADKKQVQLMVKRLLKLNQVPKPDDAADAVAVALAHFFVNKQLVS